MYMDEKHDKNRTFCFGLHGLRLVGDCLKHLLELFIFSVSDTIFQFQMNNSMTECSVELIQFDQAVEFSPHLCCPISKAQGAIGINQPYS